jgi:hypothetical protein
MTTSFLRPLGILLLCLTFAPTAVMGQEKTAPDVEKRLDYLQSQINGVRRSTLRDSSDGAVLFLYGVFCALWAQSTGRNAWLWFFTGMLFSVITVLVLLAKNSDDRRRRLVS